MFVHFVVLFCNILKFVLISNTIKFLAVFSKFNSVKGFQDKEVWEALI